MNASANHTQASRCSGCGATLQTTDKHKLGYIPEQALQREPVICQRCFRIRHYNEMSAVAQDESDYLRILNKVGSHKGLIVHIVDLFDFEGTVIGSLPRFVGGNPIILVANKIDLFPKSLNRNKLINWLQRQAKAAGLKPVETVLCSALRNDGFDRLLPLLAQHRAGRDIYVVGATNVGKSSLINRLIRDFSNLEAELTISRYPGTTLDMVHIPLDDGKAIIDTPGIVYRSRLTELVDGDDLAAITPTKPIKPVSFQLDPGQTIFFGAMARLDFVRGAHQSFTFYTSGSFKLHRTKLERADSLYEEHRGGLLAPPGSEAGLAALPVWTRHALRLPPGGGKDVLISGLGWVKVNSLTGAELVVHAPKGVKVIVREAMI